MSTLEDDLRELSDLLPGIPGEATAASQSAAALVAAAAPLQHEVEGLGGAAHDAVRVTSQLGQAFAKHANELAQALRADVAEATGSWTTARHAIEEAADKTFIAAIALSEPKAALLHTMDAHGHAIEGAIAQGDAVRTRLDHATIAAKNGTHEHVLTLRQESTAYHDMLKAVPRLNDAADEIQARARELHDEIAEAATALHESLTQKAKELEDALRQSLATFTAELEGQRTLVRDTVQDDVAKPLDQAADAVVQSLAALAKSVEERDRRLVDLRAQLGQKLGQVEHTAQRIPDGVRDIHAAYERIDGI